jgi:2-octaprenylphenol hydroxylase
MQQTDYDVIIVGSGTVGATLACALLRGGMNVALIEITPATPINTETPDLRVFALTRASERIFINLGLWDAIVQRRASPFRQMYVWDTDSPSYIHFDSASLVEPLLGHIVEQSILQTALLEQLTQFDTLTWYRPAKIQQFDLPTPSSREKATIHLDNGAVLTTRLLVSAEGAHSAIRTLAGIPYTLHDYGQQAIVTNIITEQNHQETAWQRFLPTGPLAFLPLLDPQHCSIVWSADTPLAQRLMALEKSEFLQALTKAFANKLGLVLDCGQRLTFPLQRRYIHQYVQPRLALVGDAAHTVHPLAGQGVNLGLLDVAALSEIILNAYVNRQDFGQYQTLRRYERWRKGHNLAMVLLMDGFKQLFSTDFLPLLWARTIGLNLTNDNVFLKQMMMRRAMGLSGDLPKLATV